MDNAELRQRVVSALQEAGFSPMVLRNSWAVLEFAKSNPISIVVLETNDDAALVVRLVYELNRIWGFDPGGLPIIPILSPETIERNPGVAVWVIDHYAAVVCTVPSDEPLERVIPELVRRIALC